MRSSGQNGASLSLDLIMDEDRELLKAKDYAYRLLSYRQRSTQELRERLNKKGFTAQTVKKTVEYLSRLKFLNDENFARFWVQTRIQSSPLGWSLLRYQLRQKGITEELIEKVFGDYRAEYDEVEAAKRLASLRRRRYKDKDLKPLKLKKRLYDYLCRRGFSREAIMQAIE
jgi:regulatory protein